MTGIDRKRDAPLAVVGSDEHQIKRQRSGNDAHDSPLTQASDDASIADYGSIPSSPEECPL